MKPRKPGAYDNEATMRREVWKRTHLGMMVTRWWSLAMISDKAAAKVHPACRAPWGQLPVIHHNHEERAR